MKCLSSTHDYFYGKDSLPTTRYYSGDGIHLSHSGIKRLLDAVNVSMKTVQDFELCVFGQLKARNQQPSSFQQQSGHQRMNAGK